MSFAMDIPKQSGILVPACIVALALFGLYVAFYRGNDLNESGLLEINKPTGFWFGSGSAASKQNYLYHCEELTKRGLAAAKKFFLHTDGSRHLILSGEYADMVKGHEDLNFRQFVIADLVGGVPGLEPFAEGATEFGLVPSLVKAQLTAKLPIVTKPLSEEMSMLMEERWTKNRDWHSFKAVDSCLYTIARLSSRVFLGPKLCRDPVVLQTMIEYTTKGFAAALTLRQWPPFLRNYVHWFIPQMKTSRHIMQNFREILEPEIRRRQLEKASCARDGVEPPTYNDTIAWLEALCKGQKYDPVSCQLALSLAAIHTTADLLCKTIFTLCEHQDLIAPLREEIAAVLGVHGWKKTSFVKLRLLDAVLKETHRMNPLNTVAMQRRAMRDTKLADGTRIRKGTLMEVSSERLWDSTVHDEAQHFDAHRWLTMREKPGGDSIAQHVTASSNHIVWGYGQWSCPGRFFASNELKIALIHIIMNYDIKFVGEPKDTILRYTMNRIPNPAIEISVRRREAEIDLDALPE